MLMQAGYILISSSGVSRTEALSPLWARAPSHIYIYYIGVNDKYLDNSDVFGVVLRRAAPAPPPAKNDHEKTHFKSSVQSPTPDQHPCS